MGVLPIGYGDGVRRGMTNNADVLVDGHRCPLVGTVSMDNVTVELGPATQVSPGAVATLIGAQGEDRILCEEVARRLETINYEVTCGISSGFRASTSIAAEPVSAPIADSLAAASAVRTARRPSGAAMRGSWAAPFATPP